MPFHYSHSAAIPAPRSRVFSYYESAGAAERLTPDFSATLIAGPSDGVAAGSHTAFEMGLPWIKSTLALGLPTRIIPPTGVAWLAEHGEFNPGTRFIDVQKRGPFTSWTHTHTFTDSDSGTDVLDQVDYDYPGSRITSSFAHSQLDRVFAFRTRQTIADLEFARHLEEKGFTETYTFLITGESGLVGRHLSAQLRALGHRVIALGRSDQHYSISKAAAFSPWQGTSGSTQPAHTERSTQPAHTEQRTAQPAHTKPTTAQLKYSEQATALPGLTYSQWDPSRGYIDHDVLAHADFVINLAGTSIMNRFTDRHKKALLNSRIEATRTLVDAIAALAPADRPRALINASASGYYGAHADAVTEQSPAGSDTLAHVCQAWEAEAQRAEASGVRVCLIRTGLVLSARGGILGAQLPLYIAGLGGKLAGGKMWQPWISSEDLSRIYLWAALNSNTTGPINAAAPHPVRQETFARTLGEILGRPTLLPTPALAPAALLGAEGADQLALASVRMEPKALGASGYPFRFSELDDALRHTLGK